MTACAATPITPPPTRRAGRPRALVVGDTAWTGEVARSLAAAGARVVGTAADADAALRLALRHRPDVVVARGVLDDGLTGLAVVERIARRRGNCRALVGAGEGSPWVDARGVASGTGVIMRLDVARGHRLADILPRARRRACGLLRARPADPLLAMGASAPERRLITRLARALDAEAPGR